VEGSEDRVLVGTSFQPHALSFALLNLVGSYLRIPALPVAYRFNYIVGTAGDGSLDESATWVGASELAKILAQARSDEEYGEIFFRKALGGGGDSVQFRD